MKVFKKSTEWKKRDVQKATQKVFWRCVVPGCKSNKSVLRHAFPKNVQQSEKWKEEIKNADLDVLTSDELRNYRVCCLHFSNDAYSSSCTYRRVLRNDAVPQLLLPTRPALSTGTNSGSKNSAFNIQKETKEKCIDLTTPDVQVMDVETTFVDPLKGIIPDKVLPQWDDEEDIDHDSRGKIAAEVRKKICESDENLLIDMKNIPEISVPGWNILPPPFLKRKEDIPIEQENSNCNLKNLRGRLNVETLSEPCSTTQDTDSSTSKNDLRASPEPCSSSQNLNSSDNVFTTPKTSRQRPILRSITRKKNLTPVASRLHGFATRLLKHQTKSLQKLHSYKERVKRAEGFMQTVEMKEIKSLSKEQLAFLEMQIRNIHKEAKARRFTSDEKILALSIYKQSAQCYRLLCRLFILPTPRSLRNFLRRISLRPGVNRIIFDHLKEQGSRMSEEDKVCFLAWDEVSLDAQIYYDMKEDKIVGFEDWGNARSNKFADHSLLFVLRGIKKNWILPLSYNFCKGSTSAKQLTRCIKEIIRAVTKAGFKLVATVCDQGATNVACINSLLNETKTNCLKEGRKFSGVLELNGENIIPLYDPPHLIKGIRNNLLTKYIEILFEIIEKETKNSEFYKKIKKFLITSDCLEEIERKSKNFKTLDQTKPENIKCDRRYFASWDILELAYDIDCKTMNCIKRQMPKIHDGHIRKKKIHKMRVNPAAQVLSRTMAAFIRWLTCIIGSVETVDGLKSMPIKEGIITSEVTKFFNDVFDSVNGSKLQPKKDKNVLRREVTTESVHMLFWKEAANSMEKHIRFVDPVTKKPQGVPSLKNWTSTLRGFSRLWNMLKKLGFKHFSPKNVNQDALENFFGMIRSHGRRNNNPTCIQFESSYKALLINNLTSARTVKGNCQDDDAGVLFSLRNFALLAEKAENSVNEIECKEIDEDQSKYVLFDTEQSNRTGTTFKNNEILTKVAAILKTSNCCECATNFSHFQNFDLLLKEAHSCLEANIPFFCFKKEVVKNLKMPLLLQLDFSFITCETHFESVVEKFAITVATEYVLCWCRVMNRLLKGKNAGEKAQDHLSKQAILQYKKKLQKKNR